MNSWHVRCWCGLREIENAGEASPYLDKKEKIFEKKQDYQSINKCEREKVSFFFRKQFSKYRASDNSDLQIK